MNDSALGNLARLDASQICQGSSWHRSRKAENLSTLDRGWTPSVDFSDAL
jgi:hypothetical protein